MLLEDTIAAIATPLGEGAIGIIRVSGKKAIQATKRIFTPLKNKKWWEGQGHRLYNGYITDPEDGRIIDEVLLSLMRSPHSFTGEDVVEINCHGGILPLQKTLELLLRQGVRAAEPGEFSRRAFFNGRLDLAQAEAIMDIVRAKTDVQLKMAASQLKGDFSEKIRSLRNILTDLLAAYEVTFDFPEEVEAASREEAEVILRAVQKEIKLLIASAKRAEIYREGALVVLAGRANVGKSSLLNVLLGENRAIVTDIPGTTRDVIEELVNLKGVPVRIADTAGLCSSTDPVEKIGIEKAKQLIKAADLILFLIDVTAGLTAGDREIIENVEGKKVIYLLNKIDLTEGENVRRQVKRLVGEQPVLKISALTGAGIEELEEMIYCTLVGGPAKETGAFMVFGLRHKVALEEAGRCLDEAITGLRGGIPEDFLALDLKRAWEALGEITGTAVTEDIIDRIFANFCVGK